MKKKTAILIGKRDGTGSGRIYKLTPPLAKHRYVWVSATVAMFSGPETYIFGCNAKGEVSDWGELDGSYRGGLNHEQALRNAGYQIVEEER